MARIRSKDTAPEMQVRRLVHGLGYRYRLHQSSLPGKPDLVFKGRKKIIFVHGCFWHAHEDCNRGNKPKSNKKYWSEKLRKNVERDSSNISKLKGLGWDVLVVWECEVKNIELVTEKVVSFLENTHESAPNEP